MKMKEKRIGEKKEEKASHTPRQPARRRRDGLIGLVDICCQPARRRRDGLIGPVDPATTPATA